MRKPRKKYAVYAVRYTMDNGNCINVRRNYLTDTLGTNPENAKMHVRMRFRMTEGVQMEYANDRADYLWLEAEEV